MKSIIVKINDLIDAHGKTYTKCEDPNCEICNQIRNLSEKLCPGFKETKKKYAAPFEDRMTKERYLKLKRRGYTDKTIASEYGVSISTISNWKKKYFTQEEREKMQQTKQKNTKQQAENQTIQIDGKAITETVSADKAEDKTIRIDPNIIAEAKQEAETWKQQFEEVSKENERLKRELIDAHKLVTSKEQLAEERWKRALSIAQEKKQLLEENESLKNDVRQLEQKIKDLEAENDRYFADFIGIEQELKGLRLFAFEKLKKDVHGA